MEQIILRRIIEGDERLFFLVNKNLFINPLAKDLWNKVQSYHSQFLQFPTRAEIEQLCSGSALSPFVDNICTLPIQDNMSPEYLAYELKNNRARDTFIDDIKAIIKNVPDLGYDELSEQLYNTSIKIREFSDASETIFDPADMAVYNVSDIVRRLPCGLEKFDIINGGFAPGELVLIGGMRGSGKSIVSLNLLLNYFLKFDFSVVLFSIEMAKNEVNNRLKSIISGVPNDLISKNELSEENQRKILAAKIRAFYDIKSDIIQKLLDDCTCFRSEVTTIEQKLKTAPKLDKRFFIIDDPNLSLSRIDYYMSLLKRKSKAPILTICVDYLNIINDPDNKSTADWKVQNELSRGLKRIGRMHQTITIAPIQINDKGDARFAKAIEDHVDCVFKFQTDKEQHDAGILPFYIDKMRNGRDNFSFQMLIDWPTLKLNNFSDIAQEEEPDDEDAQSP